MEKKELTSEEIEVLENFRKEREKTALKNQEKFKKLEDQARFEAQLEYKEHINFEAEKLKAFEFFIEQTVKFGLTEFKANTECNKEKVNVEIFEREYLKFHNDSGIIETLEYDEYKYYFTHKDFPDFQFRLLRHESFFGNSRHPKAFWGIQHYVDYKSKLFKDMRKLKKVLDETLKDIREKNRLEQEFKTLKSEIIEWLNKRYPYLNNNEYQYSIEPKVSRDLHGKYRYSSYIYTVEIRRQKQLSECISFDCNYDADNKIKFSDFTISSKNLSNHITQLLHDNLSKIGD